MPNLELADILRRGTAVWNSWREGNAAAHVNFNDLAWSGAPLAAVNFARAFLIRADLSGADLRRADFSGAILRLAHCDRASFRDADFGNADLFGADFESADLRNARFGGAFLRKTRLHDADLRGATGLSQQQLDAACGDENTKLPVGLRAPAGWRPSAASEFSDDPGELALPAAFGGQSG